MFGGVERYATINGTLDRLSYGGASCAIDGSYMKYCLDGTSIVCDSCGAGEYVAESEIACLPCLSGKKAIHFQLTIEIIEKIFRNLFRSRYPSMHILPRRNLWNRKWSYIHKFMQCLSQRHTINRCWCFNATNVSRLHCR